MFTSRIGLIATVVLLGLTTLAQGCTVQESVPPLERQAQEIDKGLMCPVCPGESIDQSQNPLAKQMRAIVREKLESGWKKGEIQRFFVERYGLSVLMAPPERGFNLLVWVLPPVFVGGAAVTLYLMLRSMRSSRPAPMERSLSDEERQRHFRRIQEVMEGEEGNTGVGRGDSAQLRKGDTDG